MHKLPLLAHDITGRAGAPWLCFVPGIGNDASFWEGHAADLSDRFRILLFDPWGHSRSPPPPPDCGFDAIVDGVVQLWEELGIDRASVVGLGFGGSVGLALALRAPTRIDRLVACCCRGRQPDDRREFWRARCAVAREQGMATVADTTVDRWLDPAFRGSHPQVDTALREMVRRTTVEGYCAYVQAFAELDIDARLGEIRVPTLLVAAERDHGGGPVADMRAMATRIPDARIQVLAGSGHICNYEAPAALLGVLNEFLCGERPRAVAGLGR